MSAFEAGTETPVVGIAFQTDKRVSEYGALAQAAEHYGFGRVSLYNDLLYQPAWIPMLEIARHTERAQIGVAAVNPFTCHPINIAGNMALIDEVAGGRAYLGIARGAWLDFIGVVPKQPVAALKDAIGCVRHLWRQETAPFHSEHFPLSGGDSLRWRLLRHDIPIMLGAWGARTIRACLPEIQAIKLGGTANAEAVHRLRGLVGETVEIVVGAVTVVDEDQVRARRLARREVARYLPEVAGLDESIEIDPEALAELKQAGVTRDYASASRWISDELLASFAFAGSPEHISQQAMALIEAGATCVEFGTPHGLTAHSGLRLLGERVVPALADRR